MTSTLIFTGLFTVLTTLSLYALYIRYFATDLELDPFSNDSSNMVSLEHHANVSRIAVTNSSSSDVELPSPEVKIKKLRRQLKRNLRTLNYISLLESNYKVAKDSERVEEIRNLRENLQKEIVRNTKLLNNYRSVLAIN